jgi:hypothetical protein
VRKQLHPGQQQHEAVLHKPMLAAGSWHGAHARQDAGIRIAASLSNIFNSHGRRAPHSWYDVTVFWPKARFVGDSTVKLSDSVGAAAAGQFWLRAAASSLRPRSHSVSLP